jgi:hypothetical protein
MCVSDPDIVGGARRRTRPTVMAATQAIQKVSVSKPRLPRAQAPPMPADSSSPVSLRWSNNHDHE